MKANDEEIDFKARKLLIIGNGLDLECGLYLILN